MPSCHCSRRAECRRAGRRIAFSVELRLRSQDLEAGAWHPLPCPAMRRCMAPETGIVQPCTTGGS